MFLGRHGRAAHRRGTTELKHRVVTEHPYEEGSAKWLVKLTELPPPPRVIELITRPSCAARRVFGYTAEDGAS